MFFCLIIAVTIPLISFEISSLARPPPLSIIFNLNWTFGSIRSILPVNHLVKFQNMFYFYFLQNFYLFFKISINKLTTLLIETLSTEYGLYLGPRGSWPGWTGVLQGTRVCAYWPLALAISFCHLKKNGWKKIGHWEGLVPIFLGVITIIKT